MVSGSGLTDWYHCRRHKETCILQHDHPAIVSDYLQKEMERGVHWAPLRRF